jgi:GGDEF domain-containing protein
VHLTVSDLSRSVEYHREAVGLEVIEQDAGRARLGTGGHELLVLVAGRLRRWLRPSDTAARFGGDEFAILLEDVVSAQEAADTAERVLEFKMRVGEVSKVVESEFGYHILKLTDMRPSLNELPYESVAQEISRELLLRKRAAVYDSLITTLRKSAKIDVVDPDLKYALELADSLAAARAAEDTSATRGFLQAIPEPRVTAPTGADTAVVDTTGGE